LPLIRQVLDFYRENKDEVDVHVAEKRSALERLEASIPPSPAYLRLRQQLEKGQRSKMP
jgi:hypothetical protein